MNEQLMNECTRARELDQLDPASRERWLAHAAECPDCALALQLVRLNSHSLHPTRHESEAMFQRITNSTQRRQLRTEWSIQGLLTNWPARAVAAAVSIFLLAFWISEGETPAITRKAQLETGIPLKSRKSTSFQQNTKPLTTLLKDKYATIYKPKYD